MDAKDRGVVGYVLILQDVHAAVLDIVVGHLRDSRCAGDAADKEQGRQNHAGFNGNGEIGEDSQRESDQPNTDVGFRKLQ